MKLKKVLSSILIVLGCVMMLIGLVSFALPRIDNQQLQLFLSSFETPSDNPLIQLMNDGMNFAMENCFLMLLIGSAVMMTGILLTFSVRTDEAVAAAQKKRKNASSGTSASIYERPAAQPEEDDPVSFEPPAQVNPFARYLKDDGLPKSTAVQTASPITAPPAQPEAQGSNDDLQFDILHIWDEIRQQPQSADGLCIQPVHVDDDEAYRRPVFEEAEPIAPEIIPEAVPVQADKDSQVPVSESTPVFEQAQRSVSFTEPPRQSAREPQRPVIRSTFRNAAGSASEADTLSAAPSASTGTNAAPSLQPASRIKSTMGRKR